MCRVDIPEILKPFYFNFHWSQKKLWSLDLQKETMAVECFLWLLDYPIWATRPPHNIFDLKPADVMKNPEHYPKHFRRIQNTDLAYPIHIMFYKHNWVIMDGFHRLMKCVLEKRKQISVYKLIESQIDMIVPDGDNPSGYSNTGDRKQ